jgi:hypothetical protein
MCVPLDSGLSDDDDDALAYVGDRLLGLVFFLVLCTSCTCLAVNLVVWEVSWRG